MSRSYEKRYRDSRYKYRASKYKDTVLLDTKYRDAEKKVEMKTDFIPMGRVLTFLIPRVNNKNNDPYLILATGGSLLVSRRTSQVTRVR